MMSASVAVRGAHDEMDEFLRRLEEQHGKRHDQPDVERRQEPAAREQETLEDLFHDTFARQPQRWMPRGRTGRKAAKAAAYSAATAPVPIWQATPVPPRPQ